MNALGNSSAVLPLRVCHKSITMPREIIHWDVVCRSIELTRNQAPAVYAVLDNNRAAACVGALAHDALYYFKWGASPFVRIAESLHGTYGEDTFVPLRRYAERICELNQTARAPQWAFLLGMVSHLIVDICFHPLVYYFTGNYNDENESKRDEARREHRLLEVYLDEWHRPNAILHGNGKMKTLLRQMGKDLKPITNELDLVFAPDKFSSIRDFMPANIEIRGTWLAGLKDISLCQSYFYSPIIGPLVRGLSSILGGKLKETDALFRLGRTRPFVLFNSALEYKNPVTGEVHKTTVKELHDSCVSESVTLFTRFEPLLRGESTDVQAVLGNIQGRSLNVGVYATPTSKATFFSSAGLPLPGLKHQ